MDRELFEKLRDLPNKIIEGDISFQSDTRLIPNKVAENIIIKNDLNINLKMNLRYNEEIHSKTINIVANGNSPICRLDVDGTAHKDQGRSHKHSLLTARCPARNLPNAISRSELSGKPFQVIFKKFCHEANIDFKGNFKLNETEE